MNEIENTKLIFSKNLKHYMSIYNLSQSDVSKIAGVSQQSVSNWLNCKLLPRMGAIEKIASELNIKKSDLLEDRSTVIEKGRLINDFYKLLNEKQYTMQKLSEKSKIPQEQIKMYADGNINCLNDDELHRISKILDVDYFKLIDREKLIYSYMSVEERHLVFSQFLDQFELFIVKNDYDTSIEFINIALKCLKLNKQQLNHILKIIETFETDE